MEDQQQQVKETKAEKKKNEGSKYGRADVKCSVAKTGRADDDAKQRRDKNRTRAKRGRKTSG